jgi:hypothetical protein
MNDVSADGECSTSLDRLKTNDKAHRRSEGRLVPGDNANNIRFVFGLINEFYSGNCPPVVDPLTRISLDLKRLCFIAGLDNVARGSVLAAT